MSRFLNNFTVTSSSRVEEYRSLYQGLRLTEDRSNDVPLQCAFEKGKTSFFLFFTKRCL